MDLQASLGILPLVCIGDRETERESKSEREQKRERAKARERRETLNFFYFIFILRILAPKLFITSPKNNGAATKTIPTDVRKGKGRKKIKKLRRRLTYHGTNQRDQGHA